MSYRPRITEESVLTRWMGMEIALINDSLVAGRKTLASLLAEENPTALTKGGGDHHFSREILAALGAGLDGETRKALKLPIIFFFDMDISGSCYLADGIAVRALQVLGDLGEGRRLTKGRLWVARAIAYAVVRKYPTAIQFAMT